MCHFTSGALLEKGSADGAVVSVLLQAINFIIAAANGTTVLLMGGHQILKKAL